MNVENEGVSILGVRVDDVTYQEALARIGRYIQGGGVHQVATVNVEFIMEARRNPVFQDVLAQASLCVPDSVGVMWAARWQGRPLRRRVAGVDLVEMITAQGAERGWRIYFLGAAPGVAEQAATVLGQRYPGFKVAGCYAGSPRPEEEDEIVGWVRAARPDVLLVAYGAPKQDLWIARNQARIGVPVAMGVGGSFDYIAGAVQRAPRWMQRAGLEWLYRLVKEPWRLRRQMAIPHFMWLVLRG
ncbi:MAG: WecB/TagA/CpsF family glycosyltransferase [Anaerolineae bacterium]|jgi:N-acetylglucosaminyldiphosphoundecaprenol N-acetyl-beta-D-mannosaminyltransferase